MESKIKHYKSQNIDTRYKVVIVHANEMIIKYIKNQKFDLIVMAKKEIIGNKEIFVTS